MGYFEVHCQLCGVSFNINRIRTRDEPRHAGWGETLTRRSSGWKWVTAYYDNETERCRGNEPDGCVLVHRGKKDSHTQMPGPELCEDDPEAGVGAEDPKYEPNGESEDEALEWDSEAEDEGEMMVDDVGVEGQAVRDGFESETEAVPEQEMETETGWLFRVWGPPHPWYDSTFLPLSAPFTTHDDGDGKGEDNNLENFSSTAGLGARTDEFEHIAGRDCHNTSGYSGHRISLEEMIGATTVQCLVAKTPEWRPLPDDMGFERETGYQLTGLSDHMPSSGWGLHLYPERNGVSYQHASNEMEEDDGAMDPYALPFHPTCFEIFRRISVSVLGRVDVEGLVRLWDGTYSQYGRENFKPVSEDVDDCCEQVWKCVPGTEYLAANPIFISRFRAICEAAVSTDGNFSIHRSPFPERRPIGEVSTAGDYFLKLPQELKQDIIGRLGSSDIAALRLASRAFTHLPISLWHRLLKEEVEWAYEAWCGDGEEEDVQPYKWAMLDAAYLFEMDANQKRYAAWREAAQQCIQEEMSEIYEEWKANTPMTASSHDIPEPNKSARQHRDLLEGMAPMRLPRERTNWYQLYRDITVNRDKILGLRNRRRIWEYISRVVGDIRIGREEEARD